MMTPQAATSSQKRHGLSASEARELCERVLKFSKAENSRVNINSGIQGFTRTAANRVTTSGTMDDITVQITSAFGKRVATIETNRLDDASIERAVRESEAIARISPENPQYLPELGPQTFTPVDGYYESTGNLSTESRAQAATLGIKAADAAKAVASGYIETRAGSVAVGTSRGLFGHYSRTGVSSTLTVGQEAKERTGTRSSPGVSPATPLESARNGEAKRRSNRASTWQSWSPSRRECSLDCFVERWTLETPTKVAASFRKPEAEIALVKNSSTTG
jgi:predicted Zn-dependent protease